MGRSFSSAPDRVERSWDWRTGANIFVIKGRGTPGAHGGSRMKACDFLAEAEALPFQDLSAMIGHGGLLVVAPHPDDESLGCGGLIAEARARNVAVRLLVVSDGVGSHPKSRLYPPARLKALREAETIEAVAKLGLDRSCIRFLGLPDAAVPVDGPQARRAEDAIVEEAAACRAGAVCVTWGHDPHCDHQACAALVAAVAGRIDGARIFAYPIWGWTLPRDAEVRGRPVGLRLDIARHVATKTRAVLAHRSQTTDLIPDDPDGFRLEAAMLKRFERPYEIFLHLDEDATS